MIKTFTIITGLILLTGCAGNQKFDCPYKDGVRCKPLGEIDNQINSGELNSSRGKGDRKPLKKLEPMSAPSSMLRTEEEVLSVWVAPYQTDDGTYHEEKVMHFVARPAEWVAADEIKLEQE